jgi:hypothetical protein
MVYVQVKWKEWEERSKIEWVLDLNYLEKFKN